MFKKIFTLLTVIILSGCSANNVKPTISLNELVQTKKAVVVFSITQPLATEGYGHSLFRFSPTGKTNSIHATSHDLLNPLKSPPPSQFEDRYGRLATITLDPGEYQVDWMFTTEQGHFSLRGLPARNVIKVNAGEVIYVGELFVDLRFGESFFNISVVNRAAGFLNDKSDRDIPLFEKTYPQLGKPEIRLFRLGQIVTDNSNVLDAVK